ncbi:metal ABC transporter permease [Pseudomonas sp. PCH446]
MSLGLVVLSFMHEVRIDLMGYLFGDLLAISPVTCTGSSGQRGGAGAADQPLAAAAGDHVHEELATVEGLPVASLRMALMLLIAVVIAVAMKIVGVLLITSLLIIPAAAAQRHARSPEQMALGASLLACSRCAAAWRCPGSRTPGGAVHRGHGRRPVSAEFCPATQRGVDLLVFCAIRESQE